MPKKLNAFVLTAVVLVVAVAAGAAFAGKGGNGGGNGNNNGGGSSPATSSPSIAIATVNGGAVPATSPSTKLGDSLTFSSDTAGSLSGNEYAQIALVCRQGSTIVYTWLDNPDATFTLGGGSSLWLQVGGSASCQADLDAYSWKAGQETIRTLASTSWTTG